MQKIVCVIQNDNGSYDKLNELLEDGWKIKNMEATSSFNGGACCFVLIEKDEDNDVETK